VVLLRADMDALPMAEETGLPFAATGQAMHACGHDMHVAGLVGAARLLAARRDDLPGSVVFMFQPGEEGFDGAGKMIEEGVLNAAGRPVDAVYGLHVVSTGGEQPLGMFTSRPGTFMSASAGLFVKVIGVGGHGSSPHEVLDPIPAACEMVTALQTMVGRRFGPFEPVVLTVGVLRAGTKRNIIPDEAEFEATVRTFDADTGRRIAEHAVTVCEGIAAAHGLKVEARFEEEYPATVNDAGEYAFVAETVREVFGDGRFVRQEYPEPGSEDFSRLLDRVPGAYLFLYACVEDHPEPNHSARAVFDDSVLGDGAALLAELAVRRLARGDSS
jgi:hippurate hydrolase